MAVLTGITLRVLDQSRTLIDIIPDANDLQYLDELKGQCAGSFRIPYNYGRLADHPDLIAYRNIVQVVVGGEIRGAWLMRNWKKVLVGQGEDAALYWEISGPGLRDWLHDALVYPGIPGSGDFSTPVTTETDPGPITHIVSSVTTTTTGVAGGSADLSTSDPVGTPFSPSAGSGVEPVGANRVSLTTLTGSDVSTQIASTAVTNKVTIPSGTTHLSDFLYGTAYTANVSVAAAAAVSAGAGIVGSGRGYTTVQIDTDTMNSTLAAHVQNGLDFTGSPSAKNKVAILKLTALGAVVQDLTLLGTNQDNLYNGLWFETGNNPSVSNLLIKHMPGTATPAGDTCGLSFHSNIGPVVADVEVDGDSVGAIGIGLSDCTNGSFARVYSHNNPFAWGFSFWQHTGGSVLTDCAVNNNTGGLNFERATGTYTVTRMRFGTMTDSDISGGNDQSSNFQVVINDPMNMDGTPLSRKLRVNWTVSEQGAPNLVGKANIHVYRNGVDVTSSMIDWIGVGAGGSTSAPPTTGTVPFGTLEHPFSPNSPWNIPIPSGAPLDANSAAIVAAVLAPGTTNPVSGLTLVLNANGPYGFGLPYYTCSPTTPRVTLSRKAYSRLTPIDPTWTPNTGADHKMMIIDPVEKVMYDLDGFVQPTTSVWGSYHSYETSLADGNVPFSEGRGTTGSGMTTLAGVIRLSDLAAGSIEHALAFMTSMPMASAFRYPATQTDGQRTEAHGIEEGMRVRLDPAVDVDAISGATKFEKMVMKALQKYGAICNDRGMNNNMAMGFYLEKPKTAFGEVDPYATYGVTGDYQGLPHIPRGSLQIMAESVTYVGMTAPSGGVTFG